MLDKRHMLLSLLHGGLKYIFEGNIYMKHAYLSTSHSSVTINPTPAAREEGACQHLTGSQTRRIAGKKR